MGDYVPTTREIESGAVQVVEVQEVKDTDPIQTADLQAGENTEEQLQVHWVRNIEEGEHAIHEDNLPTYMTYSCMKSILAAYIVLELFKFCICVTKLNLTLFGSKKKR